MNLAPGVQIGDFRIERLLGQGGMGIVFLAQQVSLNRLVALKIMGPSLTQQADIARFQREAQAVAKLNHPGIAKVHYVGQAQGFSYLAMEYIEGDSLRVVMNRLRAVRDPKQSVESILQLRQEDGGEAPEMRFDVSTGSDVPPTPPEAVQAEQDSISSEARQLIESKDYIRWCCEVTRDVAKALNHAHTLGVIHRDIKPENLLLDRQGQVHVIDFGLARFFEDVTVTYSGALIGTPAYMSPEQVTGRMTIDHRTDIYSLGLVLYELLALRRPIQATTREGILRQVVSKALPPVICGNRAVSRELESVVHKATSKDTDSRYQNALDVVVDLQNYLEGRRVQAAPYRYEFDRREIAAERPWAITTIAIIYSGYSLTFLLIFVTIYLEKQKNININITNHDILYISFLFLFGINSLGLMKGWMTAQFLTFAISLGIIITSLVIFFYRPSTERNYAFVYLFAGILPLILVLQSKTRYWFRLAHRLRTEHKRNASPR